MFAKDAYCIFALVQTQRSIVSPQQKYCWSSGEIETWSDEVVIWAGEGDTWSVKFVTWYGEVATWSGEVATWSGEVVTLWSVKVDTSLIVPSMNELIKQVRMT